MSYQHIGELFAELTHMLASGVVFWNCVNCSEVVVTFLELTSGSLKRTEAQRSANVMQLDEVNLQWSTLIEEALADLKTRRFHSVVKKTA